MIMGKKGQAGRSRSRACPSGVPCSLPAMAAAALSRTIHVDFVPAWGMGHYVVLLVAVHGWFVCKCKCKCNCAFVGAMVL